MMLTNKVMVSGASPDRLNNNAILRQYLGRGFAEIVGEKNVLTCCLEQAHIEARVFKPNLIVVFGSCAPSSCDYNSLRTYCSQKGALLVFWLHDDPYEFDFNSKIYNYADFIFSNDKWAAIHIDHPRVSHLPLAADSTAHYRPTRSIAISRDVFFCGVGFPNRRKLLEDCEEHLSHLKVDIFGCDWPDGRGIYKNNRVPNALMPDYYASSLITLNIGRRFNLANNKYQLDASTPGPRTFEAAMAGAVQCFFLEGLEIEDYFKFGKEILVFDSPSELREIIEHLRCDISFRNKIALNSQSRVMKNHTYAARAKEIIRACGISSKAIAM